MAPFPPAELPAFIGTTEPSDSLHHICFSPSSVVQHTPLCRKEGAGSPGLPHNHNVRHAMVSDPEEANIFLPIALMFVLTSAPTKASSFPTSHLRGSFSSTFRLTACLLAVLRLKLNVTTQPPRTCYPVAGLPTGRDSHPLDYTTLPGRTVGLTPPVPWKNQEIGFGHFLEQSKLGRQQLCQGYTF